MVAWPLTRLDICVMSDGAACCDPCSEEGLKKLESAGQGAKPLVVITGIGEGPIDAHGRPARPIAGGLLQI